MSQFNQLSQALGTAIHKATREQMKDALRDGERMPTADEVMNHILKRDLAKPMKELVRHSLKNIDPMELDIELAREI